MSNKPKPKTPKTSGPIKVPMVDANPKKREGRIPSGLIKEQ